MLLSRRFNSTNCSECTEAESRTVSTPYCSVLHCIKRLLTVGKPAQYWVQYCMIFMVDIRGYSGARRSSLELDFDYYDQYYLKKED